MRIKHELTYELVTYRMVSLMLSSKIVAGSSLIMLSLRSLREGITQNFGSYKNLFLKQNINIVDEFACQGKRWACRSVTVTSRFTLAISLLLNPPASGYLYQTCEELKTWRNMFLLYRQIN